MGPLQYVPERRVLYPRAVAPFQFKTALRVGGRSSLLHGLRPLQPISIPFASNPRGRRPTNQPPTKPTAMEQVLLKLSLDREVCVHRMRVARVALTHDWVRTKTQELFKDQLPRAWALQYLDADQDAIVVTTEEEFEEACRVLLYSPDVDKNQRMMHLHIVSRSASVTSQMGAYVQRGRGSIVGSAQQTKRLWNVARSGVTQRWKRAQSAVSAEIARRRSSSGSDSSVLSADSDDSDDDNLPSLIPVVMLPSTPQMRDSDGAEPYASDVDTDCSEEENEASKEWDLVVEPEKSEVPTETRLSIPMEASQKPKHLLYRLLAQLDMLVVAKAMRAFAAAQARLAPHLRRRR